MPKNSNKAYKRKRTVTEEKIKVDGCGKNRMQHSLHLYSEKETVEFRRNLLSWFQKNKRCLPWRELALKGPLDKRIYAVLVSEIMLQQTQVVTVKDYYTKWMARWPSFNHLSKASTEEVNEMWSGLGYYARGRRLHEAARKISNELTRLPSSASELQEQLPGVGRYTAAAVASIVYGEKVAAVDGNVIRVLARQRVIGGDSSAAHVVNDIWSIADNLVDPKEAGNFNEGMMELGATVCTPKRPRCNVCPVKNTCLASKYMKSQGVGQFSSELCADIESVPNCRLCLPSGEKLDLSLGVTNYPQKAKKAPPKKQRTIVWILYRCPKDREEEYFVVKRPSKGLLGDLWEFPCFIMEPGEMEEEKYAKENLRKCHGVCESEIESSSSLGEVVHVFSHIYQTYVVFKAKLKVDAQLLTSDHYQAQQWMISKEIRDAAVSTAMRKVFALANPENRVIKKDTAGKSAKNPGKATKKNVVITDYFKRN